MRPRVPLALGAADNSAETIFFALLFEFIVCAIFFKVALNIVVDQPHNAFSTASAWKSTKNLFFHIFRN